MNYSVLLLSLSCCFLFGCATHINTVRSFAQNEIEKTLKNHTDIVLCQLVDREYYRDKSIEENQRSKDLILQKWIVINTISGSFKQGDIIYFASMIEEPNSLSLIHEPGSTELSYLVNIDAKKIGEKNLETLLSKVIFDDEHVFFIDIYIADYYEPLLSLKYTYNSYKDNQIILDYFLDYCRKKHTRGVQKLIR